MNTVVETNKSFKEVHSYKSFKAQVTKAQLGPNHQNIWKTDIILP